MDLTYAQSNFIGRVIAIVCLLLISGGIVAMFVWLRSSQTNSRRNQQWHDDYLKSVKEIELTKMAVVSRLETLVSRLEALMDRYEKANPEQKSAPESPKSE